MVSVCVTTYNHAPYIERAVESFLAQRCDFGVEIILSDDCSSDSTLEICRSYAERYPDRVRVLSSEQNVGMRANYRRTLEAAKGKYVALCDGDDWWCDENKLSRQVEVMEADSECGLCYTCSRRVQGTREWLYPAGEMYTDFDNMLFNNTVENSSAVARKDLVMQYYAEVRPEEHPEWLTDDLPMWLWFAANSRYMAIDCPMSVHRVLTYSVSHNPDYRRKIEFVDSLYDISLWYDERYNDSKLRHELLTTKHNTALWVLSYNGGVGEYLRRWRRDVKAYKTLRTNIASYGLFAKKVLWRMWRKTKR